MGWPTGAWRLRYDVSLDAPLASDVLELWAHHAEGAPQSDGRIAVSVNGTSIGELAPRGQDWFAALFAGLGALVLAALTNGDLWGDYRFLLTWWRLYSQQAVF